MIKAVSFDGDDTLWSFDGMMRAAIGSSLNALERISGRASPVTVDEVIDIRDRIEAERGPLGPDNTVEDLRRASFHEVARIAGLTAGVGDRLTEHYFEEGKSLGSLFPDVTPVVSELRKRYKVGEITNGNSTPARFGSDLELDFIVIAQEIGISKPDARIFEHAANLAGCSPSQMVHVGDSLYTDVAGARSAGMVSVWFNPAASPRGATDGPDYEIRSLSELPGLMNNLGSR
jgi:FMN hydrolase / 5-amino-6-(5-phospho-D-ribitylamino)uracil phosphatase